MTPGAARVAAWQARHGKKAVSTRAIMEVYLVLVGAMHGEDEPLSAAEIGRRAGYSRQYTCTVLLQELKPKDLVVRVGRAAWKIRRKF